MHAIIFDIDGTLIESVAVDDALYKQSVEAVLGPVKLRSHWSEYACVSDAGILAEILSDNGLDHLPNPSADIQRQFVAALEQHVADNGPFQEIPGARRLFTALTQSQRHAVGLATGGWRVSARLKLASAGFELNGAPLATSDDAHDRRDIMRHALAAMGDGFERITYVGDGPWDQQASASLGWNFVPVGPVLGGLSRYSLEEFLN